MILIHAQTVTDTAEFVTGQVQGTVRFSQVRTSGKGLHLHNKLTPKPAQVKGDPYADTSILVNLNVENSTLYPSTGTTAGHTNLTGQNVVLRVHEGLVTGSTEGCNPARGEFNPGNLKQCDSVNMEEDGNFRSCAVISSG